MRRSSHDIAKSLRELLENARSLVLPESLDHDLLRGLGGNSTQVLDRDFFLFTKLVVSPQPDLSRDRLDSAGELLGIERVEMLSSCADHRLLKIVDQDFPIYVPVSGDGIDDSNGFWIHCLLCIFSGCQVVELSGCRDERPTPGMTGCPSPTKETTAPPWWRPRGPCRLDDSPQMRGAALSVPELGSCSEQGRNLALAQCTDLVPGPLFSGPARWTKRHGGINRHACLATFDGTRPSGITPFL